MSALGHSVTGAPVPGPSAQITSDWQLHLEEALASSRRMWVRGRLVNPAADAVGSSASIRQRWWWRRKKKRTAAVVLTLADGLARFHLQTQVGGTSLETEVQPGPDGRFEALIEITLPNTGRGWRLAKYRLHGANHTAEASPPRG
jgi:hypothetical protein